MINFKDQFKLGQKIKHYALGFLVEGTIVSLHDVCMTTEHEPVRYGNSVITETFFCWNQTQADLGYSGITPRILDLHEDENNVLVP